MDSNDDIVITKETIRTDIVLSDSFEEKEEEEKIETQSLKEEEEEQQEQNLASSIENNGIDINKQRNYKIWKKNSKILYDYINTNNLKWPSLSINTLPYHNKVYNDRFYLITSFTSDQLPEDEKVLLTNMRTLNIPKSDLNCFEMENMEFQVLKNSDLKMKKGQQQQAQQGISSKNVNTTSNTQIDSIKEYKPHHLQNEIEITYPDNEQCNRISVNLNNPDIFATASTKFGNIYIYDKTKCITTNSSVKNLMPTNYVINLNGFNEAEDVEVTSMQWNNLKEAELASGLTNGLLQIWDLKSIYNTERTTYTEPTAFTVVDDSGINDLSYMPDHDSIIAVGCESLYLQLFDIRSQNIILKTLNKKTGNNSINSLQFNPNNSNLIVTGSGDESGEINIHDIRRLDTPISTFNHSMGNENEFISTNNSISKVQWNPFLPNILLSAGMEDGLIKIWDTASKEKDNNNSRLIFTHGGHMLGVTDCCWDLFDEWTISSCSFDNSMHIWKPAKRMINEYFI